MVCGCMTRGDILVLHLFIIIWDSSWNESLIFRCQEPVAQERYKPYNAGIWWFTKIFNRALGEERYNSIRVTRRIFSNKFYYLRQHLLYRMFVESPDVACMLGVYPKVDSSHGYGSHSSNILTQFNMKCTGISRRTRSTVTDLSECGWWSSVRYTASTFCILTSFPFIGTKVPLSRTGRSRGWGWKTRSVQWLSKTVTVSSSSSGASTLTAPMPSSTTCWMLPSTPMTSDPWSAALSTAKTGTGSTTPTTTTGTRRCWAGPSNDKITEYGEVGRCI